MKDPVLVLSENDTVLAILHGLAATGKLPNGVRRGEDFRNELLDIAVAAIHAIASYDKKEEEND